MLRLPPWDSLHAESSTISMQAVVVRRSEATPSEAAGPVAPRSTSTNPLGLDSSCFGTKSTPILPEVGNNVSARYPTPFAHQCPPPKLSFVYSRCKQNEFPPCGLESSYCFRSFRTLGTRSKMQPPDRPTPFFFKE